VGRARFVSDRDVKPRVLNAVGCRHEESLVHQTESGGRQKENACRVHLWVGSAGVCMRNDQAFCEQHQINPELFVWQEKLAAAARVEEQPPFADTMRGKRAGVAQFATGYLVAERNLNSKWLQ